MTRVFLAAIIATSGLAAEGWVRVGPFGGGAELIRVNPNKPDMLLAATRTGMIFESDDRGANWHIASTAPVQGCTIHALAVQPQHDGVWFAGFECDFAAFAGLYRSHDAGATWESIPELRGDAVWSIAFSKAGDKMAVGLADGIFLSEDQEHWSRISPVENKDLRPIVSLNFDHRDEQVLYAGTTHLPWKTLDLGKTWKSIHAGMHDDSDVFSIEPDPLNAPRVFASACSGTYLSENNGGSWVRLPTPPGAYRDYFVAVDPHASGDIFVGTNAGLYRSTNSGRAWTKLTHDVMKSYAFDPSRPGVVYFASQDTGVFVTDAGGQKLVPIMNGFSNWHFCGLGAANGHLYVGARELNGCRLLDRTPTGDWKNIATPEPIKALSAAGKSLYVASGARLLRSVNGGQSWVDLPKPAAPVVAVEAAPNGSEVFAASRAGVFELAPKAVTWRRATPQMAASAPDIIERGSDGAVTSVVGGAAFFSLDAGSTWTPCKTAEPDLIWYGLAMRRESDPFGLAATSKGLFRVSGDCAAWKAVDGLSKGTVSLIYSHPTNPDVFVAAQGGRIYISLDSGAVGSSRVDLQACKLEYSIVSPK